MENRPPNGPPSPNQPPGTRPPEGARPPRRNPLLMFALVAFAMFLFFSFLSGDAGTGVTIEYDVFVAELRDDNVAKVTVTGTGVEGEFRRKPTHLKQSADQEEAPTDDKPAPPVGESDPPAAPAEEKDPPKDSSPKPAPEEKAESKQDEEPKKPNLKFTTELIAPIRIGDEVDRMLLENKVDVDVIRPSDGSMLVVTIYLVVTIGLFVAVWFMFRRAREQMMGGGMLAGFSKSPAKRYQLGEKPITFEDVAGLDSVKHELEEVVEFLKNPKKFQRLGGRVPKGVLLMGPPGTGKTLLGRAVAGEAGVPFFSINGSEFIQMFVGVGASRVRDMFSTAKEAAPSILFIDEIDAVGRHRGAGLGGGNDEREQTLNQILSEMDGFLQSESVIVMAATNRPDVLDPALLRPGRFDRHITVDRPNYKGRLAIFKVHVKDVPLDDDVDLERLAAGSVGLTGADIRNLVNEAALWASRHDKDKVCRADFEYARDKVLMGAKRDEVLTGREKSMTAYHEAGHALLAWLLPEADRVHKVSIIPRGRAMGVTQLLPEEDRLSIGENRLRSHLVFMLGGRCAEKLQFDEYSAGAEDDLKRATQLARRMITHWGMSERLGPVAFRGDEEHPFLGKEMSEPRKYSEHTAQIIDEEVLRLLTEASERANRMLTDEREKLQALAEALEKDETLDEPEIEDLIGPAIGKRNGDDDRP